jgi:tRNA(fMet)-specific endonuclease VapC
VLARVASTVRDFEKGKEIKGELDPGVLASLQELGTAFERKSVTKISLTVPGHEGRKGAVRAVYTPAVRERISARMKAPTQEPLSIEGKLEMADFKDTGRVCRIHPSIGLPVQCSFDPSKEDEIYRALRRPARVTGIARVNPHSGKVEEIRIEKIEILHELMLGARNFTAGYSLEQLAEMQGVRPLASPNDLAGGWPPDDSIDEFIDETYRSDLTFIAMDAILLDTDVFSFLMKGTDTRAELYKPYVKGKTIALSFVTVGELFAWSVRRNWGTKELADLEQRIKAAVVVPYDLELCRQFGRLKAECMKAGSQVPANDLWIAA